MRKAQLKITKSSSPLLLVLGLYFIIILSGCIQNPPRYDPDQTETTPESAQFNPEQAEFFDPISNETGRLRIRNNNFSGRSMYHQDQIELLTGLRDAKGNPGANYSLKANVIYTFYGDSQVRNLTARLGLILTTNNSGIAHLRFTYDQYIWPYGMNSEGNLEILCNEIPNASAISPLFTFTYYRSRMYRNSTTEGGIGVIYDFENRSLNEEVLSLGNGNNDFINWTDNYGGSKPFLIDAKRINSRSQHSGDPHVEFLYKAWALYFDPLNITHPRIKAIWGECIRKSLSDYDDTGPDEEKWLSTGPFSSLNLSQGWLILQYMYRSTFTNGLEARALWWYQIAILDDSFQLQWLIIKTDEVMA